MIIFSIGSRSRSELSPFLLNLSVFNIIMTVYCIPFTITSLIFQRWLYARTLCMVLDVFKTFSVSGVLLTLIAIAVDRYCAVKFPLAIKAYSVNKRNSISLFIIWTLSIGLAVLWSPARSLPMQQSRLWVSSRSLLHEYFESLDANDTHTTKSIRLLQSIQYHVVDTIQCVPNKNQRPVEVRRSIINFLQTYFVPLSVLAFVYLRIAATLWRRSNDGNNDVKGVALSNSFTHESIQFKKKLKQGIKTLVAVVILYAFLWLPMNVFQLSLNLLCYQRTQPEKFCSHGTLLQMLYIASHFLTVSNTAINPIIYGFTNHRFRKDIQLLKHRICHCQRQSQFYYSSTFEPTVAKNLQVRQRQSAKTQELLLNTRPK